MVCIEEMKLTEKIRNNMPPNSLETGVCHVLIYGSYVWLALQVLATLWLYIYGMGYFLN